MTESPITIVCHVRAPLLLEPVDSQVETLQACESEGTVDDLLLRSWPKEVTRSETSPHQEVLETFERFESWADRRGVSIRPPFRERTRTSLTGETRELLMTPLLCLEVYEDDELVGVFPHSDDETDETATTDEAIATLRTGEVPTPLGELPTESAGENDGTCPDCGDQLVDGQGLFACRECGWLGTVDDAGQFVSQESPTRAEETPTIP